MFSAWSKISDPKVATGRALGMSESMGGMFQAIT